MKAYVLLDRDGTIIFDRHYLADPDGVELLPGAAAGLRRLREAGCGLIVTTNQSGVARGIIAPAALDAIHERLRTMLAAEAVTLDAIYSCVHRDEDRCGCRKPRPGMGAQAAGDFGFRPEQAFVVGDRETDVDFGRNFGATSVLVRTGHGAEVERRNLCSPAHIADDLSAAAEWIAARLPI